MNVLENQQNPRTLQEMIGFIRLVFDNLGFNNFIVELVMYISALKRIREVNTNSNIIL